MAANQYATLRHCEPPQMHTWLYWNATDGAEIGECLQSRYLLRCIV